MADQPTSNGDAPQEAQNEEQSVADKIKGKAEDVKGAVEDKVNEVKGTTENEASPEEGKEENDVKGEEKAEEEEPDGLMTGVYLHTKSENLEEFLEAVGVNWFMRKLAAKTNPTIEIQQRGEKFYINLQTGPMNKESKFTVGEPFEEKGIAGNMTKVNPRMEDDKLVQDVEPKEGETGKSMKITREVKDNQLIMTMEVGDIVCTRYFNKKT